MAAVIGVASVLLPWIDGASGSRIGLTQPDGWLALLLGAVAVILAWYQIRAGWIAAGFLTVLLGRNILSYNSLRLRRPGLVYGSERWPSACRQCFSSSDWLLVTAQPSLATIRRTAPLMASTSTVVERSNSSVPGDWDGQRHRPDRAQVEALADQPHLGAPRTTKSTCCSAISIAWSELTCKAAVRPQQSGIAASNRSDRRRAPDSTLVGRAMFFQRSITLRLFLRGAYFAESREAPQHQVSGDVNQQHQENPPHLSL